jgi:hypothetical protein
MMLKSFESFSLAKTNFGSQTKLRGQARTLKMLSTSMETFHEDNLGIELV